jgi:hypothetical protein
MDPPLSRRQLVLEVFYHPVLLNSFSLVLGDSGIEAIYLVDPESQSHTSLITMPSSGIQSELDLDPSLLFLFQISLELLNPDVCFPELTFLSCHDFPEPADLAKLTTKSSPDLEQAGRSRQKPWSMSNDLF